MSTRRNQVSTKNPVEVTIFLILVMTLVAIITMSLYPTDPKKIALIAEDYSKQEGITPQKYFGEYMVIPEKLPITKYRRAYRANSIAWSREKCDSYAGTHPTEYILCERNKLTILSNNMIPDQKLFKVTQWEDAK